VFYPNTYVRETQPVAVQNVTYAAQPATVTYAAQPATVTYAAQPATVTTYAAQPSVTYAAQPATVSYASQPATIQKVAYVGETQPATFNNSTYVAETNLAKGSQVIRAPAPSGLKQDEDFLCGKLGWICCGLIGLILLTLALLFGLGAFGGLNSNTNLGVGTPSLSAPSIEAPKV
jgi:hypothetical protein